jgi:hypothetical protein
MSGQKQHRAVVLADSTADEEHAVSYNQSCASTRSSNQRLTFERAAMENTNSFLPAYDTATGPAAGGYDLQDHFGQASESFPTTSAITKTDVPPPVFQAGYRDYDFLDPQLRPDLNRPSASDQQDVQDANMFGVYNQDTQYGSYAQDSLMLPSGPPNVATNSTNRITARILALQREHLNPLAQQQQQQQYGSGPDVNALRERRQGSTGYDALLSSYHPTWAAAVQRDDSDSPPRHFQQEAGLDANDAPSQGFVVGTYPLPSALDTVDPANLQRDGLGASQMPGPGVNASAAYGQAPPYPAQHSYVPSLYQPGQSAYNSPHNQNLQHACYAQQTPNPLTTAPATPVQNKAPSRAPRAPGPNVGTSVPAHLAPLIKALLDLLPVSSTQNHPVRQTLKMPFLTPEKTEAQKVIRKNFYSGSGYLRSDSDLMKWYMDSNVFPKAFWEFLIQGEPRLVERDENGKRKRKRKRKRAEKVKGEEGGEVKKQKREENGAAEKGGAEEGVVEEVAAEEGVGEDIVVVGEDGEGEAISEQESSGSGSGSSEEEGCLLKSLPCNKVGVNSGDLVGELIAGDASELFKSGLTADGKGRFRDRNGDIVGLAAVYQDGSEEGEQEGEEDGEEE